jgi:hypothetical protein
VFCYFFALPEASIVIIQIYFIYKLTELSIINRMCRDPLRATSYQSRTVSLFKNAPRGKAREGP